MSIGAVGYSSANSALWAKLQESMQSKNASGASKQQGNSPTSAISGASPQRMSGASPSSRGSLINVMA